jgi:PAS domain S-box-containing protein
MAILDLAVSDDPLSAPLVAVNEAMNRLLVRRGESALGRTVADFTLPDRRKQTATYLGLLASSQLDGYQLRASIRQANGTVVNAQVWIRRLELSNGSNLAAALVAPADFLKTELNPAMVANATVGVGVIITDGSWVIQESSDAVGALLGSESSALVGRSLLTLVHAEDTPSFLLALAQTIASRQAVVARVRMAGGDGTWREVTCLVSAVSRVDPLRLGIVVASGTAQLESDARRRVAGVDLMAILEEITASGVVPSLAGGDERVRKLAQLSGRQREIVTRLLAGERVPQIAREMYLSPSTVRNHLSAVFRRFGVHSQVELIALLGRGTVTAT